MKKVIKVLVLAALLGILVLLFSGGSIHTLYIGPGFVLPEFPDDPGTMICILGQCKIW